VARVSTSRHESAERIREQTEKTEVQGRFKDEVKRWCGADEVVVLVVVDVVVLLFDLELGWIHAH